MPNLHILFFNKFTVDFSKNVGNFWSNVLNKSLDPNSLTDKIGVKIFSFSFFWETKKTELFQALLQRAGTMLVAETLNLISLIISGNLAINS